MLFAKKYENIPNEVRIDENDEFRYRQNSNLKAKNIMEFAKINNFYAEPADLLI